MVNTLAAMHSLKGKQIDFTQAFPQAKLKEDIFIYGSQPVLNIK
jgi:hypothetical protein